MEELFLKLFNMSISAMWLIIAILPLRLLLKKAPKAVHVCLWALVGIRLVFPISLESALSLIPSAETVPPEIMYESAPKIESGIGVLNSAVNPVISETLAPQLGDSVNPMQIITLVAAVIWLCGVAAMLIYALIAYLRLLRAVRVSICARDNIWLCDNVSTPFILGFIRPRIYLPSAISEQNAEHVIAHERAHLRRLDHLWKPLGFLLLSVYWFNPAIWLAYVLLCRDIELACDQRVIRKMEAEEKKGYSEALLAFGSKERLITACPLAFGETGVKNRIKSVFNYKKPTLWIIIVTVILIIATIALFLTNPPSSESSYENKMLK
ncbi:MAG: hypothetical protein IJY04_01515, partial [Clostridia bacterium]|nr:hypothetical protein [Clostridia bacterium]